MASIRSQRAPPPEPVAEEDISADMLDQIPDVEPVVAVQEEAPLEVATSPTLQSLLAQLQREMESLVSAEFQRIEDSMTAAYAEMEASLQAAQAELEAIREENARLAASKDRYEQAFAAIKGLADRVEEDA